MKNYFSALFFAAAFACGNAYGSSPILLKTNPNWNVTTIGAAGLNDTKNGRFVPAFNANSIFFNIFSAGLEYKNSPYLDSDKFTFYLGAGIGPFIQFQGGFSDGRLLIRSRYEFPFGIFSHDSNEPTFLEKYMAISFSCEKYNISSYNKYFREINKDWVLGIGIGFVLDQLWRDWL
jgi:hypothetical protein